MVKRVSSRAEAWQILHNHCIISGDELAVSIDSEGRVDVDGGVTFRNKQQREFPLWFGKIAGDFTAMGLRLHKLEGAPYWVGKHFRIENNRLVSLSGGPEHVGENYLATGNPLQNLDGLATYIGDAVSFDYHENLPVLRTLVAKKVWPNPDQVKLEQILQKYAEQGMMAMYDCQKDLIDAGFSGNAKW